MQELKNLVEDYKKLRNRSNKTVIDDKKKYSLTILKNINPILTNYAEDKNISLILDKKNILVGTKVLDITDEILSLLNNETKNKELLNEE